MKDNPEPLKITFDKAPVDIISKILGTVNEKYQCSVCFQIRPVMITLDALPSYSLLEGVDYATGQSIVDKRVMSNVEILDIPVIEEISTSTVEFESTPKNIFILGSSLDKPNLRIKLGPKIFTITASYPRSYNRLEWCICDTDMSAGSYPISIEEMKTKNGDERIRSVSNVKIVHLIPSLEEQVDINANEIILSGKLLGNKEDAVIVAFCEKGKDGTKGEIVHVYNSFENEDYSANQKTLKIRRSNLPSGFSGEYRLILRVNNQQAKKSPEVDIPS